MQDAVDSALESINMTTDKLGDLGVCVGTRDEKKLEWAEAEDPPESFRQWQREASDALRDAFDGLQSMRFDRTRLELRFSDRHPIVERHQEVQAELKKWYDSLAEGVQKGFDQTLDHLLVTLGDTNSGGAISAFKSACREWFDD